MGEGEGAESGDACGSGLKSTGEPSSRWHLRLSLGGSDHYSSQAVPADDKKTIQRVARVRPDVRIHATLLERHRADSLRRAGGSRLRDFVGRLLAAGCGGPCAGGLQTDFRRV